MLTTLTRSSWLTSDSAHEILDKALEVDCCGCSSVKDASKTIGEAYPRLEIKGGRSRLHDTARRERISS